MNRLSYAHCGGTPALLGETIGSCLDRIAERHPDREAVVSVFEQRRCTFSQFQQLVNQSAKSFLHLGIARGDRVALWSTNSLQWAVTQFATARVGAVLVNINPAYRTHELTYVLQKSRAKVLLLAEAFRRSDYVSMLYEVCPEAQTSAPGAIRSTALPHLQHVVFLGQVPQAGMYTSQTFAELGADVPDDELPSREAELEFDDVINIQYTSGTTGVPKGVQLTHHSILNNGFWVGEILELSESDRVCIPVPFYHCFGMVIGNLATISHAGTVVLPAPVFEPGATLQAVQSEQCTVLHGVPTMFHAELNHADFANFDLHSLRTGIMAGAPCPTALMRRVVDEMHLRDILIAYGQTESSPVMTLTRKDDPLERRVSTVGRVMPHQELKIVDPASGKTVPRGTVGEICSRGYMVMQGYDQDPEATQTAIDQSHWLHSGDLGFMDEEGYVSISGRIKDMVIRGGENVYPREIEEFLLSLPPIADAQVVGVPDPKFGEELLACVKLRPAFQQQPPTADQFRDLCRDRIAHFKIPRHWMVVDEFPMTVTGKVQKFMIREMAIRQLQLG